MSIVRAARQAAFTLSKQSGLYELRRYLPANRSETKFLRTFVRPGSRVFDIGANRGFLTNKYLMLGCTVIAVEPQQRLCDRLCARWPNYLHSGRLTVIPAAVGTTEGEADLYLGDDDRNASLNESFDEVLRGDAAEWHWQGKVRVPVTTLDRLIESHGVPDFCKIDVEGFEIEVLNGLSRPLPFLSFEFQMGHAADAVACVRRIERLARARYNYVYKDDPYFRLADALPADEFVSAFTPFADSGRGVYGDVYAWTAPGA